MDEQGDTSVDWDSAVDSEVFTGDLTSVSRESSLDQPIPTPGGEPPGQSATRRGRFAVKDVDGVNEEDAGLPLPSPGVEGTPVALNTEGRERRGRFTICGEDSVPKPNADGEGALSDNSQRASLGVSCTPLKSPSVSYLSELEAEKLTDSVSKTDANHREPTERRGRFAVKDVEAEKCLYPSQSAPDLAAMSSFLKMRSPDVGSSCTLAEDPSLEPNSTKSSDAAHKVSMIHSFDQGLFLAAIVLIS